MHRVKFLVKNIKEGDPEYRVVTDRSEDFTNFQAAMAFVRALRARISGKEILLGNPTVEVA